MRYPPLENIAVVAYRGLRDLKLGPLGRVNLVFGPNNSGKTSVLEAISLFSRPLDLRQWMSVTYARDPGRVDESRLMSLRWCFPQRRTEASETGTADADEMCAGEVEIRGSGPFPVRQFNASYQEVYGELTEEQLQRRRSRFSGARDDFELNIHRGAELGVHARIEPEGTIQSTGTTVWEDEPFRIGRQSKGPSLRTEFVTSSSYHAGQQLVRLVHHLKYGKYRDLATKVMREFDGHVSGLDVSSSRGFRPTVYVIHEQLGAVPLSAFGDGMKRAVSLMVAAAAAEDGVLLLDEIESGIHFAAISAVFKVLLSAAQQFNVQVVATTHSLDAVDAFLSIKDRLDEIVAFRLPPPGSDRPPARFPGQALYELRYESGKEVR